MSEDTADKIRYTMILSRAAHESLTAITQRHKISQAEAIECVLANLDQQAWAARFDEVRIKKLAEREGRRQQKRRAIELLTKLSPEEIARLTAAVGQNP